MDICFFSIEIINVRWMVRKGISVVVRVSY